MTIAPTATSDLYTIRSFWPVGSCSGILLSQLLNQLVQETSQFSYPFCFLDCLIHRFCLMTIYNTEEGCTKIIMQEGQSLSLYLYCTCTIIIIHTCIRMYLPNTDSIFTSFTAMMASAILQYQYYYYEEFITCSVLFTFSLLLSLSCVDRPFDEGFLKYETFCKCCQVPV